MNKFRKDYIESPLGLKGLVDQHDRRITELEDQVKKLMGMILMQAEINTKIINLIKDEL